MTPREHNGNISVLMTAAVVLGAMLCLAVARLSDATTTKARADTAADAAALAAADQLALGHSTSAAVRAARDTARDNGATLLLCTCSGRSAVVVVTLGGASTRARADVSR